MQAGHPALSTCLPLGLSGAQSVPQSHLFSFVTPCLPSLKPLDVEEHPAFLDCKFYENEALTRDVKFQSQMLSIGCTLPRHLNSLKDTLSHHSVATWPQPSVCPTLSHLSRMHRNHAGSIPKKQGPRETSASLMPRGGLSREITVPRRKSQQVLVAL